MHPRLHGSCSGAHTPRRLPSPPRFALPTGSPARLAPLPPSVPICPACLATIVRAVPARFSARTTKARAATPTCAQPPGPCKANRNPTRLPVPPAVNRPRCLCPRYPAHGASARGDRNCVGTRTGTGPCRGRLYGCQCGGQRSRHHAARAHATRAAAVASSVEHETEPTASPVVASPVVASPSPSHMLRRYRCVACRCAGDRNQCTAVTSRGSLPRHALVLGHDVAEHMLSCARVPAGTTTCGLGGLRERHRRRRRGGRRAWRACPSARRDARGRRSRRHRKFHKATVTSSERAAMASPLAVRGVASSCSNAVHAACSQLRCHAPAAVDRLAGQRDADREVGAIGPAAVAVTCADPFARFRATRRGGARRGCGASITAAFTRPFMRWRPRRPRGDLAPTASRCARRQKG